MALRKTGEVWAKRTPLWVRGYEIRERIVARFGEPAARVLRARAGRVVDERGVFYKQLPENIRKIVDEIYWVQFGRRRKLLSIAAGTPLLAFGTLERIPAMMEAGVDVASGRFLPPSRRGSLRKCYKRLRQEVAETNNGKIRGLRESIPNYRIEVDIFGNIFFKPKRMPARARERQPEIAKPGRVPAGKLVGARV